jgi:hypothetical protein
MATELDKTFVGDTWIDMFRAFGIKDYFTAAGDTKNGALKNRFANTYQRIANQYYHESFADKGINPWEERCNLFAMTVSPEQFKKSVSGKKYDIDYGTSMLAMLVRGPVFAGMADEFGAFMISEKLFYEILPHVPGHTEDEFNLRNSAKQLCDGGFSVESFVGALHGVLPSNSPMSLNMTPATVQSGDVLNQTITMRLPSVIALQNDKSKPIAFFNYSAADNNPDSVKITGLCEKLPPLDDSYYRSAHDVNYTFQDFPEEFNFNSAADWNIIVSAALLSHAGLIGITITPPSEGADGIVGVIGSVNVGQWLRYNAFYTEFMSGDTESDDNQ